MKSSHDEGGCRFGWHPKTLSFFITAALGLSIMSSLDCKFLVRSPSLAWAFSKNSTCWPNSPRRRSLSSSRAHRFRWRTWDSHPKTITQIASAFRSGATRHQTGDVYLTRKSGNREFFLPMAAVVTYTRLLSLAMISAGQYREFSRWWVQFWGVLPWYVSKTTSSHLRVIFYFAQRTHSYSVLHNTYCRFLVG